jgi:serine/threonine protein kinase
MNERQQAIPPPLRKNWVLEDFIICKCITDDGATNPVWVVRMKENADSILSRGPQMAMKVISKVDSKRSSSFYARLKNELEIHTLLHEHPNVVRLFGCFEQEDKFYILMEYAENGDLFSMMSASRTGRLEKHIVKQIMRDLVDAVKFCHVRGVIHRDLKPENILIGDDGRIRLADFGLSLQVDNDDPFASPCGTVDYWSPELIPYVPFASKQAVERVKNTQQAALKDYVVYHYSCDIWAMGAMLYEMLVGFPPFHENDVPSDSANDRSIRVIDKIAAGHIEIPSYVDIQARSLIRRMMARNPASRPRIDEVSVDAFLDEDILNSIPRSTMKSNTAHSIAFGTGYHRLAGQSDQIIFR